MVLDVLTGLSLINSAVKIVSKSIRTAKDISELAGQIDNIQLGKKQLDESAHPIIGRWDKLLHKTLGKTGDRFSLGQIAKETISQKLAFEQEIKCKAMINSRFGQSTWDDILEERRNRIADHQARVKKLKEEKGISTEKMYKVLEYIAGLVVVALAIGGVVAYIYWAKK
jgi:hypothetical protein|tara:strand:+ start:56 stop:562 length:507 start_codon:yes stop_codon:yes gene_type:complete